MSIIICPLCEKRINDWQIKNGKVVSIMGHPCHLECALSLTITAAEEKISKREQN